MVLRSIVLYPGDEVDLKHWVNLGVDLVQDIGQLEHQLVVLNIQGFIRFGVSHANREAHRSIISATYMQDSPLLLILIVLRTGIVQISSSETTDIVSGISVRSHTLQFDLMIRKSPNCGYRLGQEVGQT
jgi:hypothetical protein